MTPLWRKEKTSLRDWCRPQTHISWTLSAQNVTTFPPCSLMLNLMSTAQGKKHSFAIYILCLDAHSFSPSQREERPSFPWELPGEERETEHADLFVTTLRWLESIDHAGIACARAHSFMLSCRSHDVGTK